MEREYRKTIPFWICLLTTIGLFVGGFIVPPTGVVDGSVLEAGAILGFFACLYQIPVIIEVAGYVRMTKGDMTIEAHHQGKENENDNLQNTENND